MSGARPGARREQTDNYVERLEDLERIGAQLRAASSAPSPCRAAARCGSTCRRAASPTSARSSCRREIARKISDELTFPGQIKVTVIREMRAVEVAG